MGTVVKDKKGNLLAELIQPGDGYCICRGGDGGRGTLIPSAKRLQPTTKREAKLEVPSPLYLTHTQSCSASHSDTFLSGSAMCVDTERGLERT